MGKYDAILGTLKKMPKEIGAAAQYQDKVDDAKPAYSGMSLIELVAEFTRLRSIKEKLEEQESLNNVQLAAVQQLMEDSFADEGVSSINLDGVGTVRAQPEPYAHVTDPDAFRQFCMEDDTLRNKLTLPWMTLNSLTKERLLQAEGEPPGVEAYLHTKFVFTRKR